jgi:glutathione S-transferase
MTPTLTLCELGPGAEGLESWSPFCLKVHRALRLAGLRYERRHGSRPGEWRRLNPRGQVPVLLVGDEPVFDSTAILRRLDAISGGALTLGDADADAEAWLWEELADTSLNGFLVAARWADDANWPRVRAEYFGGMPAPVRAIVPRLLRRGVVRGLVARDVWRGGPEACWSRFDRLLDDLERRAPATGFWCGPRPCVADVALFGQLQSLRTSLTRGLGARVESHPRLRAWLDRVNARTAAGRADLRAA